MSFWNILLEFPRICAYTWNLILLGVCFGIWCQQVIPPHPVLHGLKNLHTVICPGFYQVPSSTSVEASSLLSTPSPQLTACGALTVAILTGVMWYFMILWISISRTLSYVDNLSWDLFRMVWLKLTCWNWFQRSSQVGHPFRWPTLGQFVRGGVSYRLTWRPCEYGVPIFTPLQVVLWQKTRRRPLVFRPHADFFFPAVISLLLCIGVELICVVLFVSSVQELDSVPLRHSSVLFRILFSNEVITLCSLAFPVVFSRSFWLLHLIYIKV